MTRNNTILLDGRLLLLICLALFLGACGPSEEENNNQNNPTAETQDGYPAATESSGYPGVVVVQSTQAGYPSPATLATDKPAFSLDTPLTAGAMEVTGQAPESLPLAIVDISFGGVILGTGVSDEDGRFTIPTSALPEGHRIGVTITEIEEGITFEQLAETYFPYRGEGFMNIPNVGIFYDTAMTIQ